MADLTVLGIGNILMGDEGIGVHLLAPVRDGRRWGEGIEFIDGGVGGLGLLNFIEQADRLVVFDAAEMQLAAGQYRIITPEQLADEPADGRLSMHDVPFAETLDLCKRFGRAPATVRIMAIQPKSVEFGRQLSDELAAAFDGLARAATELVEQTVGL